MGRRMVKKLEDINARSIECSECGRLIKVMYDKVESVKCEYCSMGLKDVTDIPEIGLEEFNENSLDGTPETKVKRKRGRPKGSKNKKNVKPSYVVNKKKMVKKESYVGKKESSNMENSKSNGKGKRGRKATVGAALLSFMKEHNGKASVEQLQEVYSSEREKMGKKSSPEVEARNLHSTLYMQKRSGKIEEVEKNKVYRIVS